MSDLIPRNGRQPLLPAHLDHRTTRSLVRMETRSALAKRSDALRIERIADAATRGQAAIAHVSAMEAMLVQTVPHAEPRLRAIADSAAAGIVHVVYEASL